MLSNGTPSTTLPSNLTVPSNRLHDDSRMQPGTSALEPLALPFDFAGSSSALFLPGRMSFPISKSLYADVKKFGSDIRKPLSMILLGTFKVLLYRYSNQPDIPIGVIATRPPGSVDHTDGLLGSEFREMVLLCNISDEPGFADLVKRIDDIVNENQDNDRMSFKSWIEAARALGKSREPGIGSVEVSGEHERGFDIDLIFQAVFEFRGLEDSKSSAAKLPGTAKPLVWLTITETHEGMMAHWQFNAGLFAESTIRRLADHFQNLLFSIVANPNESIGKLQLLSSHERLQILFEWNNTHAEYPAHRCIHELFEQQAALTPDAIAVECYQHDNVQTGIKIQSFNYQKLNEEANRLANYLRQLGVAPDMPVGVLFTRSFEMLVALFAVLKAGGAYVPLDPGYPVERLQFMLRDSGASVLVTRSDILKDISLQCEVVVRLDNDVEKIAAFSKENLPVNVQPDNLAYVIYTSGSTGLPKGTLILHRGVVNYLSWCIKEYEVAKGSGAPVNSSIAFDATVTSVFAPLLVGKRILLLPEKDEIEVLSAVLSSNSNFSLVKITPAHLNVLEHSLQVERLKNQVQTIVIGGEALNYKTIALWRKHAGSTRLVNEYGPTETVVGCCTYEVSGESPESGDVPIGRPISNTQIYILDPYLQPVPIGVPGEIYIGGAGVARGYLNRPELTAERFVTNPFDENQNARLYKTGDLGRYLPTRDIVFMGRIDHQVKIRGYRIEVGEIETTLAKHPSVIQSIVIARNEDAEKKLIAYVATRDRSLTSNNLRSHLAKILPQYMLPAHFVFLDTLPLTPNGKVDRKALPMPDGQNTRTGNVYAAPRDKVETQLVTIFQKTLKIEKVGVADDFFELGGSSMQAAEIFAKIGKATGRQLPISTLIANPTIERLAAFISSENKATSCLVPIQTRGEKPLLFCVHGGWGHVLFYRHLAKRLGTDQPLYGLQARGLSANEEPYRDLVKMAAHYVREIRSIQPTGPYYLAGYCFGAIAAFEMARQLVAAGEKVALLASFNGTAPNVRGPKPEVNQETTFTRAKKKRRSLRELLRVAKIYMLVKRYRLFKKMRSVGYRFLVKRGRHIPQVLRRGFMVDALIEAQASYTPKPYNGDLVIFRSPKIFKSPDLGWSQLISGTIKTYDIPGEHADRTRIMYEPFVAFLAQELKNHLAEIEAGGGSRELGVLRQETASTTEKLLS